MMAAVWKCRRRLLFSVSYYMHCRKCQVRPLKLLQVLIIIWYFFCFGRQTVWIQQREWQVGWNLFKAIKRYHITSNI